MSQIFDALQRSEAERSGLSRDALLQPTEMLRRVEEDEAARWEATTVVSDEDSFGIAEHERVQDLAAEPAIAEERSSVDLARATSPRMGGSVFDDFKSLEIVPSQQGRLVSITDPEDPATEAFRLLAVRLRTLRRKRALKRVLITSSIPQEGKSTVSANLACTLAKTPEQRILLLEGDVRRPGLSKIFGVGSKTGLCECLRGDCDLIESIYYLKPAGVWFLPAGDSQSKPLEHLQSSKLPALIERLSEWFDWIIIDSTPVLPLADTSIWTRLSDGILLVARPGITERRLFKRGIEALDGQKVIGALMNSARNLPHSDYYYYKSSSTDQVE